MDGADDCWNCGSDLSQRKKAANGDLRARQRTGVFSVVYKIGDVIAGRFAVTDIVGSGGAGVVYRAQDQNTDDEVAVKVINGKLVQTADEQALFAQETSAAKNLDHENCIRIRDTGMDEERPFFTMPFLEGLSLRRIIDLRREKGQVFTSEEVEPIFNQLCQALDYAHRTGFHGNLKPDNVIVLPDLLKVTDFPLLRGLPRKPFLALQKSRGHNLRYLAPEVRLEVTDIDKAADVFSLGVILTEMLTGHVYYDLRPEALDVALAALHPELADTLRRCVERAPDERFLSALEVYQAFKSGSEASAAEKPAAEAVPVPAALAEESRGSDASIANGVMTHGRASDPAAGQPAGPGQPVSRPPHDAPTQRLDIDKHGERPIVDDEPLFSNVPSVTYQIDDGMIEAELAARSQDLAANSPFEDEDLIDNPGVGSGDLGEEEETIALEEPGVEIRAMRAQVEARLTARARSVLEEISNSNIELIADPTATHDVAGVEGPPTHDSVVPSAKLVSSAVPSLGRFFGRVCAHG